VPSWATALALLLEESLVLLSAERHWLRSQAWCRQHRSRFGCQNRHWRNHWCQCRLRCWFRSRAWCRWHRHGVWCQCRHCLEEVVYVRMYVRPSGTPHFLELGPSVRHKRYCLLTSLSPCVQDTGEDEKTTQCHGSARAHIKECHEA
jgi:hypothetical protein